jgi:hypothetical protein
VEETTYCREVAEGEDAQETRLTTGTISDYDKLSGQHAVSIMNSFQRIVSNDSMPIRCSPLWPIRVQCGGSLNRLTYLRITF